MIRTVCLVLLLLIGNVTIISAQQSEKIKQADRYIDVVKVYELVVEEGYESAQIFEKLAHSYFAKRNYTEANKWFIKLFEIEKNPKPLSYLQFSKTLKELSEHSKASEYLVLYEHRAGK